MKWEVWDQIWTGEVNVALWGHADCPVARCNEKEQWDITHPENTAQRVRWVTWLCFCLPARLTVSGRAHSQASVTTCSDGLRPGENVSASSRGGSRSASISPRVGKSQSVKRRTRQPRQGEQSYQKVTKHSPSASEPAGLLKHLRTRFVCTVDNRFDAQTAEKPSQPTV